MKKQIAFLSALALTSVASATVDLYVGPHFNYTKLHFNNPEPLEGFQGGVTAGTQMYGHCVFFGANFEGTWDAIPMRGEPCQRSSLCEYFLEGMIGASLCSCRTHFRPYVGFGGDQFINVQDPTTAKLKYKYEKLFVPFGVFIKQVRPGTEIGAQLEYRLDVLTRLRVIGQKHRPKKEFGVRGQLFAKFVSNCGECGFFAEFVPFFDWDKYGKVKLTNSVGATLEIPDLKRWHAGLRLLIGYRF